MDGMGVLGSGLSGRIAVYCDGARQGEDRMAHAEEQAVKVSAVRQRTGVTAMGVGIDHQRKMTMDSSFSLL